MRDEELFSPRAGFFSLTAESPQPRATTCCRAARSQPSAQGCPSPCAPQAPLTVDASVRGMLKVLSSLSEKETGAFLDWEGKVVPW